MKGSDFIKILAFDQSMLKTGICLIENDIIYHFLIEQQKNIESGEKFSRMIQEIKKRIIIYDPDIVVIEGVVLQRSPKTLIQLSRLQGSIIGICESLNKK